MALVPAPLLHSSGSATVHGALFSTQSALVWSTTNIEAWCLCSFLSYSATLPPRPFNLTYILNISEFFYVDTMGLFPKVSLCWFTTIARHIHLLKAEVRLQGRVCRAVQEQENRITWTQRPALEIKEHEFSFYRPCWKKNRHKPFVETAQTLLPTSTHRFSKPHGCFQNSACC